MAPKVADTRVDVMEKDLEEMKTGLQHLPVLEWMMEQLLRTLPIDYRDPKTKTIPKDRLESDLDGTSTRCL